jgi:hypothetical protein
MVLHVYHQADKIYLPKTYAAHPNGVLAWLNTRNLVNASTICFGLSVSSAVDIVNLNLGSFDDRSRRISDSTGDRCALSLRENQASDAHEPSTQDDLQQPSV